MFFFIIAGQCFFIQKPNTMPRSGPIDFSNFFFDS